MSSYFHSASQSCPLLSANQCTFRHVRHLLYLAAIAQVWINRHRQQVSLYSDVVKGEVPRGQGKIRKTTKKKPWKGKSRSRRFSFHNYYNFFIIFFSITLLCHFFSLLFLPTTFTHTHTHTYDPRPLPTTHDQRHLDTLGASLTRAQFRYKVLRAGDLVWPSRHLTLSGVPCSFISSLTGKFWRICSVTCNIYWSSC